MGKSERLAAAHLSAFADMLTQRIAADGGGEGEHAAASNHPSGIPSPLLAVKMQIPPLRHNAIARPRLRERLQDTLTKKLSLLVAPAGYGKTTLLAEWIAQSSQRVAWVTLESAENDPVRFWRYLFTALDKAAPGAGQMALRILTDAVPYESLVALLNDALAAPCVLVLKDYHVIHTPLIHAGVQFLLNHLSPHLHLVIASRSTPPLSVARFVAQEDIEQIDARDLRFTTTEIARFLASMLTTSFTDEEIALIEEKTEGWPAGAHMLALALQKDTPGTPLHSHLMVSKSSLIVGYLLEEVLHQQPAPVQRFLLHTAILTRMCAALCDAVTEQNTGQLLLESIERANLFVIGLDHQNEWYRYHHLFAEVLRQRLEQEDPTLVCTLHRRASEWYVAHNMLHEAFRHACAAHAYDLAARIIIDHAEAMEHNGESATLLRWLDDLPTALVAHYPALALIQAEIHITAGHVETVERQLPDLAQAIHHAPALPGSPQRSHLEARLASLTGQLAFCQGQLPLAIEHYTQALSLLPADEAFRRMVLTTNLGTAWIMQGNVVRGAQLYEEACSLSKILGDHQAIMAIQCTQAIFFTSLGNLHEAMAHCQLALAEDDGQTPRTGMIYDALGTILYEWNELEIAASYLHEAMLLGRQWGNIQYEIPSQVTLARVRLAQQEHEQAQALLALAEETVQHMPGMSHLSSWLALMSSEMWLLQGNIPAAVQRISTFAVDEQAQITWPQVRQYLLLAQLRIMQRQYHKAAELLPQIIAVADTGYRMLDKIRGRILLVQALYALDDIEQALSVLAEAVLLATPGGFIRVFLNAGATIVALLTKLYREIVRYHQGQRFHLPPAALQHILVVSAQKQGFSTMSEVFSQREIEILRLLAGGASNHQIAQAAVLAVSTVKWYIKILYLKLNVHSRLQAVNRAHEIGIIVP